MSAILNSFFIENFQQISFRYKMHLDYNDVWLKYFLDNKNFVVRTNVQYITQNQNNLILNSRFYDISRTSIQILFSTSNINNLLNYCFAENCSSQNPEEFSGFTYIYTKGTTYLENICMISNTVYNKTQSAHCLHIKSKIGGVIDCSNSKSIGYGDWTSSVRTDGNFSIKYFNSSFISCKNIPSFVLYGMDNIKYCNIASNIASFARIIHFSYGNFTLFSSSFINNTEPIQGIIFCEEDYTLDVSFCSIVKNNAFSGFYAQANHGISHLAVSNCSLIENDFKYDKYEIHPSIIDYKENEGSEYLILIVHPIINI